MDAQVIAMDQPKPKHPGGRPKGAKSKSRAERAVDAALKVALRGLEQGVEVVGCDGRVIVGEDGEPVRKSPPASFLSAAVTLLDKIGAIDEARAAIEARAKQHRRDPNGHAAVLARIRAERTTREAADRAARRQAAAPAPGASPSPVLEGQPVPEPGESDSMPAEGEGLPGESWRDRAARRIAEREAAQAEAAEKQRREAVADALGRAPEDLTDEQIADYEAAFLRDDPSIRRGRR